jgi:hypothetical protein
MDQHRVGSQKRFFAANQRSPSGVNVRQDACGVVPDDMTSDGCLYFLGGVDGELR